jgi:hypothetical protein
MFLPVNRMSKFFSTVQRSTVPVIKMSFYDNPYLLKHKDQFDIYTLTVPLHFYIKDANNKITVYSMNKSWVDYNRNKELVYDYTDKYSEQMITLLNKYTINNQNITPIKSSLCWNTDTLKYTNKSVLPAFVFPKQQNNNKLKINYNPNYDIRTLLKLNQDEDRISCVWNKVAEYYE